MAASDQPVCQRHGRPAVASRVRLRPDGTQEVEYLCEIDLAEEQMSSRFGGRQPLRRLLLRFLRRQRVGRRGRAPPGSSAAPGRASRRHAVLQRRDPRVAPARRADGCRMGQPRSRQRPSPLRGVAGRRRAPRPARRSTPIRRRSRRRSKKKPTKRSGRTSHHPCHPMPRPHCSLHTTSRASSNRRT